MKNFSKDGCKRKRFFANKLHEQTFLMVFTAVILPVLIVTLLLYYLIFQIVAEQITAPEIITYSIFPAAQRVMLILLISTPAIVIILLALTHRITHQIFGPYDRILSELDNRITTGKKDPIIIRKKDKFIPLVERINRLLQR